MNSPKPGRTTLIWRDGRLVEWEDATIHVMSHVVHYGSGVFEGVRAYETPAGGAIFRAQEHMRRLLESAKMYRMPIGYSADELVQAAVETVQANGLTSCYIRPLAIRTGEQMGISAVNAPVETFIIAWHWGAYLGASALTDGVDVCVSSWRRASSSAIPLMAKASGHYLSSQQVKMEAQVDGYAEGIMLDDAGNVSEGSGENLFLVRDGVLYTPPLGAGILDGITRHSAIQIAEDLGIPVREQVLPRTLLYTADEIFFTGTAVEVTPVRSVDRIQVGEGKPGPITTAIQEEYLGVVAGQRPDRHGWLTPVPQPVTA